MTQKTNYLEAAMNLNMLIVGIITEFPDLISPDKENQLIRFIWKFHGTYYKAKEILKEIEKVRRISTPGCPARIATVDSAMASRT